MATTEHFFTGNASTTSFGYTFPILQNSDLKVELDGVIKTENTSGTNNDYSIVNTNVVFNSAPGQDVDIHIYRLTNVDTPKAVFAAGSAIRAGDLNNIIDQSLYANQEQQQLIRTADVRDKSITSVKIKDGTIVGADISDSAAIPFAKLATGLLPSAITVNTNNIQNGSITADDLATGTLDGRYFTETESDARYFRQDSSETISSGSTWSSSDNFVATTAAINARIIDLIEEVGGFVPLANETSFPNVNPDINNGNGTIVSVQAVSTAVSYTHLTLPTILLV